MTLIAPIVLEGRKIRLIPLELKHHAALCEVGLDDFLWRATTIQVVNSGEMLEYVRVALDARKAGTALPFVIEEIGSGKIIGCTRFHSYQANHKRIEIGFTWLAVPWQRSGANVESKFLMLRHAFESLGIARVEFKVDVDNTPSCRAIEKLGASCEGVLRSYMVSARSGARDVAIYSIIAAEWPHLRRGIESRLLQVR